MIRTLRFHANKILYNIILALKKTEKKETLPADLEKEFKPLYTQVKEYTMTSVQRMYALYKATKYIIKNDIPGDIVECGVWKGGSMMLCALALKELNSLDRKIYLYDTYEGMSPPETMDVRVSDNKSASSLWEERYNFGKWNSVNLELVKELMFSTGYPRENLVFIKGKVETTIPKVIPEKISLLHLDTDWYRSTYHELQHLYPLLTKHGVLILDDYGHWKGAKKAVDEYMEQNNINLLLNRVDHAGRVIIKNM